MNLAQLAGLDLNLLLVLHELLVTANATRTAERLGRTPSAISHALRRLREQLGDPLLVRVGARLEPTPHARRLAPVLEAALRDLDAIVNARPGFDPLHEERTFTIGAADYHELVLLPALAELAGVEAPNVVLHTINAGDEVEARVQQGRLDVAVAVEPRAVAGLSQRVLFRDDFVVAMRRDHPLAGGRVTARRFAAARHAVIAPRGRAGGRVDDALAEIGLQRRVVVRTAHFVTAPLVAARTDLLLTMPRRVALAMAPAFDLVLAKPPLELPGFSVVMLWSEPRTEDPAHRWLRERLVQAARSPRADSQPRGAA